MSLALLPTIAGGIGSIWAQRKAGKIADKAREEYTMGMENLFSQQQDSLDAYLKPGMYENFMQSELAQSAFAQARDQIKKQSDAIRGGVASTGATPEAAIAASTKGADQYGDIINRMYGQGTQYRERARGMYHQGMQNLLQGRMGHEGNLLQFGMDKAQGYNQLGQNLLGAGIGVGQYMDEQVKDLASLFTGGTLG